MMLSTQTFNTPLFVAQAPTSRSELSRLLAAAVVNHQFRYMLLNDPALALDTGYLGEAFLLTNEERSMIMTIRAETLTDLANQLTTRFNQKHFYLR
jgi:hypothetical protein